MLKKAVILHRFSFILVLILVILISPKLVIGSHSTSDCIYDCRVNCVEDCRVKREACWNSCPSIEIDRKAWASCRDWCTVNLWEQKCVRPCEDSCEEGCVAAEEEAEKERQAELERQQQAAEAERQRQLELERQRKAAEEERLRKEALAKAQLEGEISETIERGGTLPGWKELLREKTGPDSEVSKGIEDCEDAITQQKQLCSKNKGWMVDNAMDIDAAGTDKHYDYQYIAAKDGCPQGTSKRIKISTKMVDSQTTVTKGPGKGDYQVICGVNCYKWDCESNVKDYRGKAKIQKPDGTLKPKETKLEKGDVINTGNGRLTVNVVDNPIRLGPRTTLKVESHNSFFLESGNIWVKVDKLPEGESFTIRTPKSVVTVRGTEFILSHDNATNTSILYLYEGVVEHTTFMGTVNRSPGDKITIDNQALTFGQLHVSSREWDSLVKEEVYGTFSFGKLDPTVAAGIGGGAFGFIIFIIFSLLMKPKTCPKCKAPLPKFRTPKSWKQLIRYSVTCPKCGREVSMKGTKVSEESSKKKK